MENKRSINNKNFKQLLEKWLFIDSLSYPLNQQPQTSPMWEEKMCWGSHRILIKMNQATHLPNSIVSHIKNYENDNIFLEKY